MLPRVEMLLRYYGVGVINTAFGFGLYALLVFVGLNLYVAQITAHVTGATFNYFTYSRHVFHKDSERRPLAFVGAYAVNYVVGLALLAVAHQFVRSPYLAGFLALLVGTALNFLVLRRFVFPSLQKTVQS
jgi:putative flippase GtrA